LELRPPRLGELIDAELVVTALPVGGGDLRIEAAAGPAAEDFVGTMLSRTGSKSGRVLDRRRSERVDSTVEDVEVDQEISRRMGLRSGLYVPMIVADRAIGVIAAHNKLGPDPRLSDEEVRLAVELRPSALDDFGLLPALERLAEAFGEKSGIAVDVQANLDSTRLPAEVETALYRIVQEALTNVAKHAGASRVSIVVTKREN